VLAVLVGPPDSIGSLRRDADEVICLQTPDDFSSVGEWYEDFPQTSDEQVIDLLRWAAAPPATTHLMSGAW
jgi:putative phosphoribosyl transferase